MLMRCVRCAASATSPSREVTCTASRVSHTVRSTIGPRLDAVIVAAKRSSRATSPWAARSSTESVWYVCVVGAVSETCRSAVHCANACPTLNCAPAAVFVCSSVLRVVREGVVRHRRQGVHSWWTPGVRRTSTRHPHTRTSAKDGRVDGREEEEATSCGSAATVRAIP